MTQPLHRITAAFTAMATLLSVAPAIAVAFSDVKTSTQYSAAINALQTEGTLQGYADGTFKPGARINRAEFSKIIALATHPADVRACEGISNDNPLFSDVVRLTWYYPYICALKMKGVVGGYPDGSFRPAQDINFVEAAKIIAAAYGQQGQETNGEWYEKFVLALESSKAIPPSVASLDVAITRGEMAEMMWRLSEQKTEHQYRFRCGPVRHILLRPAGIRHGDGDDPGRRHILPRRCDDGRRGKHGCPCALRASFQDNGRRCGR